MQNFHIRLDLAMLTMPLQKVLLSFSEPVVIDSAMMTAEVQPMAQSNKKNILVQITFLPDIKVNLHVLVDTVQEMSLAATRYNMAMAHGCAVAFSLNNDCSLEISLVPPNENVYQKLCNFYEAFC